MNLFHKSNYGTTKSKAFRLPRKWLFKLDELAEQHDVTATDIFIELSKFIYAPHLETPEQLLFLREMIRDSCKEAIPSHRMEGEYEDLHDDIMAAEYKCQELEKENRFLKLQLNRKENI